MNKGKICISVAANTAKEMLEKFKRAETYADAIEVRFDSLANNQIDQFIQILDKYRGNKPLLATFRPREQGGYREIDIVERLEFWARLGSGFSYADLESDIADSVTVDAQKIVSFHDLEGVSDIDAVFDSMSAGHKTLKVAVTADDIVDGLKVWRLQERASAEDKIIIPIAMGDAGKWTRILGLAHGAYFTYSSLEVSGETAPGQICSNDLIELYRVKDITPNTKVLGIVGDPVSQSLSPFMQNPAFQSRGIDSVFIPLLVKDFDEFIRRMVKKQTREIDLNFGGFSVTMPHKQAVIRHLDDIDPTAAAIGAVNTVKIDTDGRLIGHNTDAHGFIAPLKQRFGDLDGAKVSVFGLGGAARACVYALKLAGADVTVHGRNVEKARLFAEKFETAFLPIDGSISDGTDIIVDATPIGMKGELENETLFTAEDLKGVRFVYDLVTKATDTRLIAEAKVAGVDAIGGLEMLIAQGAKQFEIWTGVEAPTDVLRSSVLTKISG